LLFPTIRDDKPPKGIEEGKIAKLPLDVRTSARGAVSKR
jgi:hypothetical protein